MIQLEILLQNIATSVLKPRIANNVLEDLSKQHIEPRPSTETYLDLNQPVHQNRSHIVV